MQIFVLGMHRSGTSIVTRILNLMGAYFAPEGMSTGANKENFKGFWERKDIRKSNDKLIRSVDAEWHLIADFAIDKLPTAIIEEFQPKARKILLELDAHRPWVVKEPRFCLTFPLWRELLEFPVCVHVYRSPIQVAQSLKTRNHFPLQFGVALWEKYTLEALKATAGSPRILVSHAEIMAQPLEVVKRLYNELREIGVQGLRLPHDKEILAFIDPNLFREKGTSDLERQFVNQQQLDLIKAFEDKQIFEKELPMNLSVGAQENLYAFEEQEKTLKQLQQLTVDLEDKNNLTQVLQKKLDEADQQKAQATAEITNLRTTLEARTTELQQQTAKIEQLQAEIVLRTAELHSKEQSIASLQERLHEADQQKAQATAEITNLRATLEAQITELQQQLQQATQQEARQAAKIEYLQAEIVLRTAELHSKEQSIASLQERVASSESEINRQVRETIKLHEQVKEKNQHLLLREKDALQLCQWLELLDHDISALLKSRRWKSGNMLVRSVEIMLLRPRMPMASDHIPVIFNRFNTWKQRSSQENKTHIKEENRLIDSSKKKVITLPSR